MTAQESGRRYRNVCSDWLSLVPSFYFYSLEGYFLQKGEGRTVACSVSSVVTYCFVMTELLELSPRCLYIRRSLGMKLCSAKKRFLHLNVPSSVCELSDVCALSALFVFTQHTVTYVTVVGQKSQKNMLAAHCEL